MAEYTPVLIQLSDLIPPEKSPGIRGRRSSEHPSNPCPVHHVRFWFKFFFNHWNIEGSHFIHLYVAIELFGGRHFIFINMTPFDFRKFVILSDNGTLFFFVNKSSLNF